MSAIVAGLPAVLGAIQGSTSASGTFLGLGTAETVFLGLWALFSLLYWSSYRKDESVLSAALKVALLLGFVYGVIQGFDWLQAVVPADQVVTFWGLIEPATAPGSRVPFMGQTFTGFVLVLLVLVAWHARRKVSTVFGVVLSAWDRGHWYMLPVIFILMTVGLLLVAAAASPVLSPFIYTLF